MQIGSSERWHTFNCIMLGYKFSRIFLSLRLIAKLLFSACHSPTTGGSFLYSSLADAASLQCALRVLTQSPLVALHKTNEISLILLSLVWRHPFHKSFRDKKSGKGKTTWTRVSRSLLLENHKTAAGEYFPLGLSEFISVSYPFNLFFNLSKLNWLRFLAIYMTNTNTSNENWKRKMCDKARQKKRWWIMQAGLRSKRVIRDGGKGVRFLTSVVSLL